MPSPIPNTGVLHSSFWAAIAIQTIGNTKNGLPPPRIYAGIFVLWFLLGLISGGGRQPARFAGGVALLTLLTIMLGKAGTTTLAWLSGFGKSLGLASNTQPETPKGTVI